MTRRLLPWAVPVAVVAVAVLAALDPAVVTAAPAWGASCLSCHDAVRPGTITVVAGGDILDPPGGSGPLPVLRVSPGATVPLMATVQGIEIGDRYAVALRRLRHPGVVNGTELDATEDCSWAGWGAPGQYFTDPHVGYRWGDGPALFVHQLQVAPDAAPDVYELVLALGGMAPDGELFSERSRFYLEIQGAGIFADGFESGDTGAWSGTVAGGMR